MLRIAIYLSHVKITGNLLLTINCPKCRGEKRHVWLITALSARDTKRNILMKKYSTKENAYGKS